MVIDSILKAIKLSSAPASCMLFFTWIGLRVKIPNDLTGALQHFSAGILLCSIGTELLPVLVAVQGVTENLSVTVGFFLGVAVLLIIGNLLPEGDDADSIDIDNDSEAEDHVIIKGSMHPKQTSLRGVFCRARNKICIEDECKPTACGELQPLVAASEERRSFPLVLLAAIIVDSIMDGLLIGIVMAAGSTAGPMMAISLAVEMSFLGLTLANSLHGHPQFKALLTSFMGPTAIIIGAVLGAILSHTLSENAALYSGLMSFGTSALLFMVAEELLLESHQESEDHVWWVDLQLYVGFLLSLMVGKMIPE